MDLRTKIERFMDELSSLQMLLLDEAIKKLVQEEKFKATLVPKVHTRNAAEKTFQPEDTLDYYYGR